MRFNMQDLNPPTRFLFDESDPDGGWIEIRRCNGDALDSIREKTIKRRVEFRRGQRFEVTDVDDRLYSEMVWDYSITGWNGLEDENGVPIPCSKETKAALMRGSLKFSEMVSGFLDKLDDAEAERKEEFEKN
jgi:hypothetical protein